MSTAETDEITSKAKTKNTKDNIKWTAQVLERKMEKCHNLKNSVKRSRKRSLAKFSYKKIKRKIEILTFSITPHHGRAPPLTAVKQASEITTLALRENN